MAGRYLVDVFPSLQYLPTWFPGAGFQKEAAGYRKTVERMTEEPVKATERDMVRRNFSHHLCWLIWIMPVLEIGKGQHLICRTRSQRP
jgi:hypothetical protein